MSRGYYLACYVFLALGLALALYSLSLRAESDRAYSKLIVLIDWEGLRTLEPATLPEEPQQKPYEVSELRPDEPAPSRAARAHWELFAQIPGAQLCYGEETIGGLLEQGILRQARSVSGAPSYEITTGEYYEDIIKGVLRHGYSIERDAERGGRFSFSVPALPLEELTLLPVAWLSDVMSTASAQGIEVVLRPGGTEFYGPGGLSDTLEYASHQPLMLFQGPVVSGYPSGLDATAQQIKDNGQSFGWVEFDEQDGGARVASLLKPNVVRVHSIPAEEMVNYDIAGAVDRLQRAVEERSIRCLYLRPFIRGKLLSDPAGVAARGYNPALLEINTKYFATLSTALSESGYSIVERVEPPRDKPAWLELPLQLSFVLAKGGAFLLLLALWFPGWPRWAWSGLMGLVVGKALVSLALPQLNLFFLIETAVVFPLLGTWLALMLYQRLVTRLVCKPACPRRLFIALLALLAASAVSIAGGLLIHSIMWDTDTVLKIGQFRGVTLALALPLLFLAGYAWQAETLDRAWDAQRGRLEGYWSRMLAIWNAPIRYGDVAFIVIVLGAVAVVLLRSGNESPLEVLSVESWFRGGLEDYFGLRPRTKELIGHPFFVLFLLSLGWRWRPAILFGLAGVLAQASMVNTFQHLHTPVLMTVERTLLGLALGMATAVVWGTIALALYWLWMKLRPLLMGKDAAQVEME